MKIALVSVRTFDTCFPINLLSLHAYLNKHRPGHQVDIIEAAFEDPLKRILSGGYDFVGIGAMSANYEAATRLAKGIKAATDIPVIVGGPHISTLPESLRDCFDVGVLGEGEEPLCELVSLYAQTRKPTPEQFSRIPGLLYRDGKELKQTTPKILDLNDYPHLDYSKIHPSYFNRVASAVFGRFGIETYLATTRGCPFRCVFCSTSHFWGKVRYMPDQWVIEEMKVLIGHGVTLLNIADDLFASNKKRLQRLGDMIRAEGLHEKVAFSCTGNAGIFDEETCQLLKRINVKPIFFGFESGDEAILKYLKCGKSTVEDNKRAIKLCQKHGLYAWGAVIIGSPGETIEQMENTIRFIDWSKKNGVVRMCVAILLPFPATPVWAEAVRRGKVSLNMNFDDLRVEGKAVAEGMLVDDAVRPRFAEIRDRAYRCIHAFKWRKAKLLFLDNPLEALKFAFGAPMPILKRLFTPLEP